jgi:hypothetical protein
MRYNPENDSLLIYGKRTPRMRYPNPKDEG